ncbi:MAG: hypothetical protein KDA45_16125, partial [Planctomycetales bacterium]|nr:hypothetical protein [Planctomycetales bacterium]
MKSLFGTLSGACCLSIALLLGCAPEPLPPPVAAPPAPQAVPQKAVAGVGQQGQKLRGATGVGKIIATPASTLFRVKQKAVLDIQIPQALKLFQATEGHYPKTHEEFMQKIVQANNLVLPDLPAGAVYHFNSEKGEL